MNILILEDELLIAEDVSEVIEELGHQTFAICKSMSEVKRSLELGHPDIALLDIRVQGDDDGVAIGEWLLKEHQIPGIFLTSHSDKTTVTNALKSNPLGYLVKPVRQNDLFVALQMAEKQLKESKRAEQPEVLIKIGGLKKKVNVHDITHIESDNNYTNIYINGQKHTSSKVLKYWLEETELSGFIRIHRSYAVNPSRIVGVKAGILELGKVSLPIGRKYKNEIEKALESTT